LYNYRDNNNYNNTINNNGILSTLIDASINTLHTTNECIHTEFNHKEYTSNKSESNMLNISTKFNEQYKTNRITPFVAQETNENNSNSFLKTIKSKKIVNNNKVKNNSFENNRNNKKDNFYRIIYLRKGKNMTKILNKKNKKLSFINKKKTESKKKDIFNKKLNSKINVKKIIINKKNRKNKIFNAKQIQSKENIKNNKSKIITNNVFIRNYPFYNSSNIMIYTEDISDEEISEFLNSSYIDYPTSIIEKYLMEKWADSV
jgi:hypothetical protein